MRVLITGTSSGIGKGIAEKFLKEGHQVTGIDRKGSSIEQGTYTHICMDIRDKAQYNVALRIAKYGATCNSLDFGGVLTELNKPVMEDKVLWNEIMEQTPLKRWMTVEEATDWAYFMTVTNRFCTGQNILIDGLEAGNAHFVWPEK